MEERGKLSVHNVSHRFSIPGSSDGTLEVLSNVSFEVENGEIVCLVGPSGCGKTTLLRIIAGLTSPTEGAIKTRDGVVSGPAPERIMLFQDLFLFDWLTVKGNIEFALEAKGLERAAWGDRVTELLDLAGLRDFVDYYPVEISGGMRQRLALARALAAEPEILLMDEPFGALDVETRATLESQFLALRDAKRFTSILVTHDVRQAVFLGDRVLVLSQRPATIKMSVVVPFPRPRYAVIRSSQDFHGLEDTLADSIRSGG